MTKTFTQDDLIRYLYRETTKKEEQEINKALLTDSQLREVFNNLCSLKKDLDAAQLEPKAETIQNILNYSRSTSAVKH